MKKIKIKDDVFKTETLFILNCDYEQANRVLKSLGAKIELSDMETGSVVKVKGDFFRAVWIERANHKNIGVVIHEIFHLVVRICQDKGIPIRANIETGECGDETAAYLMEFYLNKLFKI